MRLFGSLAQMVNSRHRLCVVARFMEDLGGEEVLVELVSRNVDIDTCFTT